MGPLWLAPACSSSLAFNCPSAQSLTTYTCAATDCHLRCNCLFWLHIHVSVLVPFVYGVRDAAAVDSGHREDIRDAERAEVRRQLEASDCARTKDCTLILNRYRRNKIQPTNEGTTLRVCCCGDMHSAARKKLGRRAEFSGVSITCTPDVARVYCWLSHTSENDMGAGATTSRLKAAVEPINVAAGLRQ
jgi:hypothetical protein